MLLAVTENVQIALVAGLLSGGFVLLGNLSSALLAAWHERRAFRTETALELSEERLIWESKWLDLQTHLQRQQTRLAVAGAPEVLGHALSDMSLICWADNKEDEERPGIDIEFLEARRKVLDAVGAHLLRRGTRRSRAKLQRDAVKNATRILNDPDNWRVTANRNFELLAGRSPDLPGPAL